MPRNRVIYQSEALFVGPTPATGSHFVGGGNFLTTASSNRVQELYRVQSANYSFNITRQDVNQYGELAAIDRVILEQPTVNLDFSYLQANLYNEAAMGFYVTPSGSATLVSCISGILSKAQDEKNYFIRVVPEGADVVGYVPTGDSNTPVSVIGIGNGFLSSYTAEGSVGNFPTVSINAEALNMKFDMGASGSLIPAVNPIDGTANSTWNYMIPTGFTNPTGYGLNVSALRPGDVTLSLGSYNEPGTDISDWKVQSYNISFDLSREPLQKLGSKYAFSREITFPVTVNMTIAANVGDLKAGNLVDTINTDSSYDLSLKVKHPTSNYSVVQYILKNAKLNSQEFSSSIGSNKSVNLTFSAQIGGPTQTTVGLFMSGVS